MDYKDTLLLPTTNFPMRGNLPENEPKRYAQWFNERDVYKKMKQKRASAKKSFNLHDGPPYANGNIHIGHALNKILKDVIIKTHYFFGENIRYVPGWDCHGLPIEQQVEKAIGKEKKDAMPKAKFRQLCREHAQKYIQIQKDEFKSLGVVGDWENPYLTMKFEFEADIYRALCDIAKKGLLVERSKPVFWSWAARSALAEAEVEYQDKEDYSIFVAFELDNDALLKLGVSNAKAVIWTTTPWTLPANMAIAFNPDEEYVLTGENLIAAKARLEALIELGITEGKIKKSFKAKILENTYALNPLNGRKSQLILGSHVLMDGGSGLVHTAPGHGDDDYKVALIYGIKTIMPVDEDGKYDQSVVREKLLPNPEEFVGVHVFKANEKILELLGNSLLKCSKFVHSYPYCWRTHTPVIYRATKQWFIAMDEAKEELSLRAKALNEIEKLKFYPQAGYKRLSSMIENRPDWCISRQRDWGVPIAFFRDKTTGEAIYDDAILENTAALFEKYGADVWWDKEIKDLLPENSKLNPENLEKVMDILDVWFDSGSTWRAVLDSKNYDGGNYPSDMYLEGSDQHRGWFQSSLLVSTAVNGKAPYKNILTHGFTVDEKGEKMSKSKGNGVAPSDIAKRYGVEILRLWVGISDYTAEVKISENIIKQVAEQYRKIRNTFRFLLSCTNDLETVLEPKELGAVDRWILSAAKGVFDEVKEAFGVYDFSKGYSLLNNFIAAELSGIYMDISKDRLYCDAKDSKTRRSAQSAMALILEAMLPLVAPVLTYTVDEITDYAPNIIKKDKTDAFDMEYVPLTEVKSKLNTEFLKLAREKFFEIVDKLKKEKIIKSTLELNLVTKAGEFKEMSLQDAEDWFTISEVVSSSNGEILGEFDIDKEHFVITRAVDKKCPRCWKFKSQSEEHLCPRCAKVING
ncbi:MAG: isoleucine--tRNA ligase [Campylobacteraceae bacterium]|jgi:isoleucyl-tRNA synthetase|nr:isoleucine--tRNA ligase [Campylobacteraceae bacterium]